MTAEEPLLRVEGLSTEFRTQQGAALAVDGVSFEVRRGELVGIVGESGSGKSTTIRSVIRLVGPPGRVTTGRAVLDGAGDLLSMSRSELRRARGNEIGFVAQNPFGALNPVYRIERQLANVVRAHRSASRAEIRELGRSLFSATGIPDPDRVLDGYAHELSGGLAQRVVIALALSLEPTLLMADEPTTALDLTVQRQVLDTMHALVRARGSSLLLVTHDLSIVASYCDQVMVMYAGSIVESGPTATVFSRPSHPYTAALLSAVRPDGMPATLRDSVPDIVNRPSGCSYRPRCARAIDRCAMEVPELTESSTGAAVACHVPLEREVAHVAG